MKAIALTYKNVTIRNISFVLFFSVVMAISSYVRIPLFFTPVPLTLQTFVLYLSLPFLKRKALYAQITYVLFGVAGLPVFTNGGAGLLYFLGPTAGYLFGFILVAAIFPFFMPQQKSFLKNVTYFSLAAVCLYSCGIFWLIFMHKLSLSAALVAGVLPFIFGEIFKIFLAAAIRLKAV